MLETKKRPKVCVIHFNKIKQAWSIHTGGVCHLVKHLKVLVPMESRERPEKTTNPRYFFTCRGVLVVDRKQNATID